MSTTANPDQLSMGSKPGSGTKTLCIKNVPHAVWQKARQNALASNLSFTDYVVRLLGTAGPFPPAEQSVWESLLGAGSDVTNGPALSGTHGSSLTPTATSEVSG